MERFSLLWDGKEDYGILMETFLMRTFFLISSCNFEESAYTFKSNYPLSFVGYADDALGNFLGNFLDCLVKVFTKHFVG